MKWLHDMSVQPAFRTQRMMARLIALGSAIRKWPVPDSKLLFNFPLVLQHVNDMWQYEHDLHPSQLHKSYFTHPSYESFCLFQRVRRRTGNMMVLAGVV